MKPVKATDLARSLKISRRTVSDWCRRDPTLAFKKGRDYYIRLERLAEKPGMDIVLAITATKQPWVKAIDLARWAEIPRRTVAYWCRTRPRFAKRIGRTWYISVEELGASPEQAETLRKWAPTHKTAANFLEFVASFTQLREQTGQNA